jgi:hypothetical protein
MDKKRILSLFLATFVGALLGYFGRDLPALLSQEEDLPTQLESGEYAGEEVLKIAVKKEDGTPLTGFEIDLWAEGKTEGPPTAAIEETDENGIATFNLKPGTYWQGYNLSNWPEDLQVPIGQREIEVKEGEINEVALTIKSK